MADPIWLAYLPKAFQRVLQGRENLLRILNNSSWLFLDKLLRLSLGVVVGAWLANYLGPSQFGEMAYALAYIAFFQAIANLGLDGITVRDITQNNEETHILLGTVFMMRSVAGVFCWVTAIIGMALVNGLQDRSIIIVALVGGVLVFQAADVVDLWFQSQSQSRRTVLAKSIAYIFSALCKVALILLEAPLIAFAAVLALEAMFSAFGLYISYLKFPCKKSWESVSKYSFKLLKESWPFILSGISIMVYMRIDQIMIKEMLDLQSLGVYAAVMPLATLWQVIPMTLNTSLAPLIAQKKSESEAAYWLNLKKLFRVYALLGWLTVVLVLISGQWVVPLLYGDKYKDGVLVLSIYIFTNLFISMGVAQGLWVLNEKRAIVGLVNTIAGAIVCIVGNYLIIPYFGIAGVAFVAVVAQFFSAVLMNLFFSPIVFALQMKSIFLPFYNLKEEFN
jgi:PST family polysaccharide transporter